MIFTQLFLQQSQYFQLKPHAHCSEVKSWQLFIKCVGYEMVNNQDAQRIIVLFNFIRSWTFFIFGTFFSSAIALLRYISVKVDSEYKLITGVEWIIRTFEIKNSIDKQYPPFGSKICTDTCPANSFPRVCELRGTDNVRGQISEQAVVFLILHVLKKCLRTAYCVQRRVLASK